MVFSPNQSELKHLSDLRIHWLINILHYRFLIPRPFNCYLYNKASFSHIIYSLDLQIRKTSSMRIFIVWLDGERETCIAMRWLSKEFQQKLCISTHCQCHTATVEVYQSKNCEGQNFTEYSLAVRFRMLYSILLSVLATSEILKIVHDLPFTKVTTDAGG